MARAGRLAAMALLMLAGCLPLELLHSDADLAQVPTSPFAPTPAQSVRLGRPNFTPAAQDVSMRVDAVGRKLLAANPQAAIKPLFATIGVATPEIFHTDLTMVYVTEGLVKQCRGEPELAAVLAHELGRMLSEREAALSRDTRTNEPLPPVPLPIGSMGSPMAADPNYTMEMARYEKEHPRAARKKPLPPPDPRLVAGVLLEQAGFQKTDLDTVAPILGAAEQNCTLERQFKGLLGPGGTPWQAH